LPFARWASLRGGAGKRPLLSCSSRFRARPCWLGGYE
jgi:hypothetical protein